MKAARLFIVVRADLPVGAQLAQVVHVTAEMISGIPSETDRDPVTAAPVAVLHVANEAALRDLYEAAMDRRVERMVDFCEPDLDGQMTAIAMYGAGTAGVCRGLSLAFGA